MIPPYFFQGEEAIPGTEETGWLISLAPSA